MENFNFSENEIDALPLAIKKFMKIEYLIYYEESKNNEKEVEELKKKNKISNLRSNNEDNSDLKPTLIGYKSLDSKEIGVERELDHKYKDNMHMRNKILEEYTQNNFQYLEEEDENGIYDEIMNDIEKNIESEILDDITRNNFDYENMDVRLEYEANADEDAYLDFEREECERLDELKNLNEEYDELKIL